MTIKPDKFNLSPQIDSAFFSQLVDELVSHINSGKKFYNSRININSDIQPGEYFVVDVGGTNIRLGKLTIFGDEEISFAVENIATHPLENLLDKERSADVNEFFNKIASLIPAPELSEKIGFCFSFGIDITPDLDGIAVELTKGINIKGLIGRRVGELLKNAIFNTYGKSVDIVVLNDVVALLLSGRKIMSNPKLALIVGTGSNSSFINNEGFIVNTESGTWTSSRFKQEVDFPEATVNNAFENLVSGYYLPYIFSHYVNKYNLDIDIEKFNDTKKLAELAFNSASDSVMSNLAKEIFIRSAKLIAAQLCAYIKTLYSKLPQSVEIIADGSVIWGVDHYRNEVSQSIQNYFQEDIQINFIKMENPTLTGAGIAAAMKRW